MAVTSDFAPDAFPLVVAHRGASADHPENTLESFAAGVDAGAQAVELDVRLTADGVPVVLHDLDVSRCTDGRGFVHELSLAEVKRLDASGGRGARAEVPTVREVLELVSGRAGVNLEIKNIPGEPAFDSPRERALHGAIEELERTAFSGPVLISSFNWMTIGRSREVAPTIPTGALSVAPVTAEATLEHAMQEGHAFMLPEAKALFEAGKEFVARAHREGIRVGTWTVDDRERIRTLFSWGVDAVASNDPALALSIRAEFAPA